MRTTKEIINAMIVELAGNGILIKELKIDYDKKCLANDEGCIMHIVNNIDVTAGILGEDDIVRVCDE